MLTRQFRTTLRVVRVLQLPYLRFITPNWLGWVFVQFLQLARLPSCSIGYLKRAVFEPVNMKAINTSWLRLIYDFKSVRNWQNYMTQITRLNLLLHSRNLRTSGNQQIIFKMRNVLLYSLLVLQNLRTGATPDNDPTFFWISSSHSVDISRSNSRLIRCARWRLRITK